MDNCRALKRYGYQHYSISSLLAQSIKRSWEQIKQMEAGEIPIKSAMSFIDEL